MKNAIELSYFSRGSVPYHTVLGMTPIERELLKEFIEERLEIAKKSTFPVY